MDTPAILRGRSAASLLVLALALLSPSGLSAQFTVNDSAGFSDETPGDGTCATSAMNGGMCTLRAAIQEANQNMGPDVIQFAASISTITLDADLPQIIEPVTILGTAGPMGSRVVIDGAGSWGCFDFNSGAGASMVSDPSSTVQDLVIQNCSGDGIGITGYGYSIVNNYIGVTADGQTAAPNDGDGISVTSTGGSGFPFPNLGTVMLPGDLSDIVNLAQAALAVVIPPNFITGNVISGNTQNGIDIFGTNTGLNIVAGNFIGTNVGGTSAIPNGTDAGVQHGIRLGSGTFANIIGPGNIVSGQSGGGNFDSDGISIETGATPWPNIVSANIIGPSSTLVTDLGNEEAGIDVNNARPSGAPSTANDPPANPTPYSVLLGPGNVVGYNKGIDQSDPNNANNTVGGIRIAGGSTTGVKVYGNFIGLAEDLVTAGTFLDLGNAGDGINLSAGGNEIGGSEPFEANFISANGLHGIAVRGTSSYDNVIRGNFIGVNPLGDIIGLGNAADGIFVVNASNTVIGGPGATDRNVIAGNGRNGIRVGTGSFNGDSNLITRNSIYGNMFLGIDLDGTNDAPDSTSNDDPSSADGNMSQNAPVLTAVGYDPGTGATSVTYTFHSNENSDYRFEVFASEMGDPDASGRTYLGAFNVMTDGVADAAGTMSVTPASAVDTRGMKITVTATDITLGTTPNGEMNVPLDNTSELSNALTVPQPGELRFTAATVALMAQENAGMVSFEVERINGSDGAVSVDFAVSDGTATSPADYTATAMGTLNWADGDSANKPITVSIASDMLDELDETVMAMLSNAQGGATLAMPSAATLTIQDDDAEPTLSISDESMAEGNTGTTNFNFTVSLSALSGKNVGFTAATADGTATLADNDYVQLMPTAFQIPAGSMSTTVTVQVNGDMTDEMADETFAVNLSSPVNATISDNQGLGTILNDDAPLPSFSIDDPMVTEGDAGTVMLTYTVSRSPTTGASSVDVASVAGGSATGGGVDYDDLTTTTLSFADTEGSMMVSVAVIGDTDVEPNETVFVELSNPMNAAILDNQGIGTIVDDDDPVPDITINDPSVMEGDAGTATLSFTLTRTPTTTASSVTVSTADGTATAADNDYVALSAFPVDFMIGEGAKMVDVTVNGDLKFEANETLTLNITPVSNATASDPQGTGTITNDDGQPTISIDDVAMSEGDAGTTNFVFTLTLSNPSDQTITVSAASSDGSGTLADGDYVQLMPTTVTFNPSVVSQTVTVQVNGDTDVEGDDTFFVDLSSPSGATLSDGQGQGTIQNDDVAGPSFSIGDVTMNEGDAGMTAFSFTVTRTNNVGSATVTATSADDTATVADGDYVALPATVVDFVDLSSSTQVTVQVNGDLVFEPNETFFVNLSNPSIGYQIADGQGLGTITNDDTPPILSIDDVTLNEGNAGTTTFGFSVSLSNPSTQSVTVSASTADDSATSASGDYVGVGATLVTFPPLSTTQAFDVTVNGDTAIEPDETFFVNLMAPGNASIGDGQGVGTILNDDSANKSFSGPTATGSGIESGSFTGGGVACGFTTTDLIDAPPGMAPVPPTEPPPGGWIFPHGMLSLLIEGCTPGATLDFTITYPQALPAGTVIWKYGPTPSSPMAPEWYQLPATINGATVTFSITDGGLGDSDLTADGTVGDPGGPAYQVSATEIPTVDWRGALAMLLLLAAVGVWAARGGIPRG